MIAKIRSIFLYTLFLINLLSFGGFPAGTLISSDNVYIPIEELNVGDLVTCYDFKSGYTEKPIIATKTRTANEALFLVINNIKIPTAKEQQFYLPDQKKWKKAIDLRVGDCLFSAQLDKKSCVIQKIEQFRLEDILYDISVKDCHNFLILRNGILAHNFIPCIGIGIIFACKSLLAFASYEITNVFLVGAVGAAGFTINYLRNKNKNNNWQHKLTNYTVVAESPGPEGPTGNNNNDDDNDKNNKTFNKAKEIAHQAKEAAKDALITEAANGVLEQTQKIHHRWHNKKTSTTPATNQQPNGVYKGSNSHPTNGYSSGYNGGIKSPAPIDGQAALNNSFVIKNLPTQRIGISENQIVIFKKTMTGEYHGYVPTWEYISKNPDLAATVNLLKKKGLINKKGKIK